MASINQAKQSVTVVRSVEGFTQDAVRDSPAVPAVAWLAFQPRVTNTITWKERCDLYMTATRPAAGDVIQLNSRTTSAQPGEVVTRQDGLFSVTSRSDGTGNYYAVNRQQEGILWFGLLEQANVNGTVVTSSLNVRPALFNETCAFTLLPSISIFLSSAGASGTVIPANGGLSVSLGPKPVQLGFNDQTNAFYLK